MSWSTHFRTISVRGAGLAAGPLPTTVTGMQALNKLGSCRHPGWGEDNNRNRRNLCTLTRTKPNRLWQLPATHVQQALFTPSAVGPARVYPARSSKKMPPDRHRGIPSPWRDTQALLLLRSVQMLTLHTRVQPGPHATPRPTHRSSQPSTKPHSR
jgi:hypothetical protein